MKIRRCVSVCTMVLLAMALMVVPVSAGKTVTPIAFKWSNLTSVDCPPDDWPLTGMVQHFGCTIVAVVTSVGDDMRLNNAVLTESIKGATALKNPHPNPTGGGWGAVTGNWRIVTSAPGAPESGWAGELHCNPWSDPIKWPDAGVVRYHGTGFGIYKNTSIDFSGFAPPTVAWNDVLWQGEIKENSK
jgi:hypothetical protein